MSTTSRPKRTGLRRLVPTWRMALGGLLLVAALAVGGFALAWHLIDIPEQNAAVQRQSNTWLYRDGSVIATTGPVNRENVPITAISKDMQHAAVAAENRSFYRDPGIDPLGLVRALFRTVVQNDAQGGSTITQQYVKNAYLDQSRTMSRKVKELFIAMKVDRKLSKNDILARYLNSSFYGRSAYGIEAAAHAYYNTDAKHLTVGQSAYLAALLNQPSAYDVAQDSRAQRKEAIDRWNYILDGMVKSHWLDAGTRAGMKFPEPIRPKPPAGLGGQAGYLVEAAKNDLLAHHVLDESQLAAGGWRITTTYDRAKTDDLASAVNRRLSKQLDPKHRKSDRNVRAGGASVDPKTGQVLALYGGTSYLKQWRSAATNDDYQVGSTFKPIVLATALAEHAHTHDGQQITPNTYYSGQNRRPVQGLPADAKRYAPPNEGEQSYGDITLKEAMDKSVNAVYVQLGVDAGLGHVAEMAGRLGLRGVRANGPSLALGVTPHSPLDMAGAYAVLDNRGSRTPTYEVLSVRSTGGDKPAMPKHRASRVLTKETADTVTRVLQGVVDDPGGTGYAAQALNRPAAGKTGTTDDSKSVWFTGYTPQLVTSVGLFGWDDKAGKQVSLDGLAGNDQVHGGTFPAQIWTDYMRAALKGEPAAKFPQPKHRKGDTGGWTPSPTATPTGQPSSTPSSTPTGQPTYSPPPTPSTPPTYSPPPTPTGPPTNSPPPTVGPTHSAPPPPTGDPTFHPG